MSLAGYEPVRREVAVVTIPDGKGDVLAAGTRVKLTQALGWSYTVQTERGAKLRIAGKDGDAIGRPVVGTVDRDHAPHSAAEALAVAREQLSGVFDPEIPVDIVNLGLVHELKVEDAAGQAGKFSATVRMGLTTPGCGMGDVLRADVEAALRAIPGVVSVDAKIVLFPVWNPNTMMSEAAKLKLGML